jgi:hypothetical protein
VDSRFHPRRPALRVTTCRFSALLPSPLRFLPSAFCVLPFVLPYSFQQLPTIKFCNSLVLITIRIARGVRTPSLLPKAAAANLHLCFQSLPRCFSPNPFAFNFLHGCPGAVGSPQRFSSSLTLALAPSRPRICQTRALEVLPSPASRQFAPGFEGSPITSHGSVE